MNVKDMNIGQEDINENQIPSFASVISGWGQNELNEWMDLMLTDTNIIIT